VRRPAPGPGPVRAGTFSQWHGFRPGATGRSCSVERRLLIREQVHPLGPHCGTALAAHPGTTYRTLRVREIRATGAGPAGRGCGPNGCPASRSPESGSGLPG
jgi:hypothetical protein